MIRGGGVSHLGTAMENEPVTLREILPSLSWALKSSQYELRKIQAWFLIDGRLRE